jgi:hydroxymethylbilane synthase
VTGTAGPVRIGTRGSQLALWQAGEVARRLGGAGLASAIVVIRTSGDRLAEASLAKEGGKRLFVKEIEDALLDGRVDLAVHSTKDMPVAMPPGLELGALLARADPWDAIVLPLPDGASAEQAETTRLADVLERLGPAPRLGTSSVRRVTQMHRLIPGATFLPIRGNVETRLRKLDEGQYDAIVLACAGLQRLGAAGRITLPLPLGVAVPAPGQGAVAVQARADRPRLLSDALARIDDAPTRAAVVAERTVIEVLEGGCQSPIGALALPDGEGLELHASVTGFEGDELRAMAFGDVAHPVELGRRVGEQLLADGAADLLTASELDAHHDE